jgi:ABC-type glutathione transport system ATPase component
VNPAPLLRAENLRYVPRPAGDPFLPAIKIERLSLRVQPGESVAVLGPRGSGKGVMLRLLARLITAHGGRIYFEDQDVTRAWGRRLMALRRAQQFVGGDPLRALLPHWTVGEALREPLQIHRQGSPAERGARVQASARQLGLSLFLLDRRIETLSLAMRQRVMLARALTLQPRLLLVDEWMTCLEPAVAAPLLENLARVCRAEHMAWLWATTDAELARRFSDRVLRLDGGQLRPI